MRYVPVALLLAPALALASVPTVRITGAVLTPDGTAPMRGSVTCALSQAGTVRDTSSGAAQRVATESNFPLLTGGVLPDMAVLVPNNRISPAQTIYACTFRLTLSTGKQYPPWTEYWRLHDSPATIDVGAIEQVAAIGSVVYLPGEVGPAGPRGIPGPSAVGLDGVSSVPLQAPALTATGSVAAQSLSASSATITGPVTADAVLSRKGTARRTAGTQIIDATTGTASLPSGAAATGRACALDTGKYAMKASWTSAASGQYTGCVFDGAWNLSGVASLWLNVGFDVSATSSSVWMLVSSDTTLSAYTNYSNSANLMQNVPKLPTGWLQVPMASLTAHGTPNLAAIRHIEIRLIRNSTATVDPIAIYVYGVWTDLQARPKVIISHDDGFKSFYDYGWPYMKLQGLRGTIYANPALIGTTNYVTLAQLQEMQSSGWAVGSHTWDHANLALAPISSYTRSGTTATLVTAWPHGLSAGATITIGGCDEPSEYNGTRTVATAPDAYTLTFSSPGANADTTAKGWCYLQGGVAADKVRSEIRRAGEWLAASGFPYGNIHFAYPYGAWDPGVITALQEAGYATARTISSTAAAGNVRFQTFTGIPPGVGMSLPAWGMDSASPAKTTASAVLAQVDAAIADGATILLYGHGLNPTNGAAALCTAPSTPYPCCTGAGTGTGCAASTEQWVSDFRAVIDGLRTRCITNNLCDVVSIAEWYAGL
jgi:hypothetical protein